MITNLIIPPWAKYVALAGLFVAVWFHGYVKGLEKSANVQIVETIKIIKQQGEVTTKVVTKYVEKAKAQEKVTETIKKEGQSYAIKFADDNYIFNNYFVRLYDASITGSLPALSSGDDADPSGVEVSEVLGVSIHNNSVGKTWELRAKACEEWVNEQRKLYE